MFDTVRFSLERECHAPRMMQELRFDTRASKIPVVAPRPFAWFTNVALDNNAVIKLHWKLASNGNDYLSAEASLPQVLNGSNVWLLNSEAELTRAVSLIAEKVSQTALIEYDAWQANIGRLDVVHQWPIGEHAVNARLVSLQRAHAHRMQRVVYDDTVYLQNKSEQFCFYSKHRQLAKLTSSGDATDEDLRAAVGLFRAERRFITGSRCRKLATDLNLPDRKALHLLSEKVAQTAVNEMLIQFQLDQTLEAGDSRLSLLFEHYGAGQTYQRLAGFLMLCDTHGPDNLVPAFMSAKTFSRQRKELEKAGAWLVSPSRQRFPPLRLVCNRATDQRLVACV